MKLADYRSTGNEPHVFRADGPEGLIGVHANLIASGIQTKEKIYYLLYAPMKALEQGPFGIQAIPGSHALAVTGHRFLISTDFHTNDKQPEIESIPFSQILLVEIGSALLLGWLVIRYAKEGRLSQASLFYTSRGSHHFEAAIRQYRMLAAEKASAYPSKSTVSWSSVWQSTSTTQREIIKPLIIGEEKPVAILRSKEVWNEGKKRQERICLTTTGIFFVTTHGCLHVIEEQPVTPGMLSFGINAYCFSLDAVNSVNIVNDLKGNDQIGSLYVNLERTPVTFSHGVPFAKEEAAPEQTLLDYLKMV